MLKHLLLSMPNITAPSDPGPNQGKIFTIIFLSAIIGIIIFAIIFNCIQRHNEKKLQKKIIY